MSRPLPSLTAVPLILFSLTTVLAAQTRHPELARAELPDAPSAVQLQVQQIQQLGSLIGTVTDVNGGLVQGATITATRIGAPGEFTATADSAGHFELPSLPSGRYKVTVRAAGLTSLTLPETELSAGQQLTLSGIELSAGATTSNISVVATPDQIATEQVHAEEKQRALGIIPNFYTSYLWQAEPMPTRQKFSLSTHAVLDPVGLLSITGIAGAEQWRNTYAGYGDDAGAFGKRYAAAFGDEMIGQYFGSAIYPTLFHQDPRYFYKGEGSVTSRAIYAITRTFVTRGDNGRNQPNYSLVLGRFTAGAIANTYHPHADRGVTLTVTNALINIGGHAFDNLFREFVSRRLTTNIPAYANGEGSGKP